jgi:ABC-type nickel/cobalt efflux system permease component RcnA
MQAVLAFITGCLAGLVHVWSGPDHLAAVAPLSANRRQRPWAVGVRWGMGHSAGVLLIGVVSLCFREALPLNAVSSVAERLVGIMLIGIGIWGIRKAFSQRVHSHPHTHGSDSHEHFHVHGPEKAPSHTHTHAAVAIGALHGVGGSSHFIGVLPALAFPSALAAGAYLMGYAAGTVCGMAGFSSAIGWMQRWRALAGTAGCNRVMGASSCVAFAVGVYWIW